jgi:hypothetical protein
MLAVAAFADWNPSHFLDTAEMTAGLALGYDWFADLSAATRATVRQAMISALSVSFSLSAVHDAQADRKHPVAG